MRPCFAACVSARRIRPIRMSFVHRVPEPTGRRKHVAGTSCSLTGSLKLLPRCPLPSRKREMCVEQADQALLLALRPEALGLVHPARLIPPVADDPGLGEDRGIAWVPLVAGQHDGAHRDAARPGDRHRAGHVLPEALRVGTGFEAVVVRVGVGAHLLTRRLLNPAYQARCEVQRIVRLALPHRLQIRVEARIGVARTLDRVEALQLIP